MVTRSPICAVVGHVDHGKSSLLDKIRGTAIVKSEAGKITQAIGASIIPLDTIKRVSGKLLEALNIDFTIPGLLFIDTPGHAAFTSLRKRGGSLADIAILVVDINEGFKPQTIEALEILKSNKTPFIVAANKVDLVPGWRTNAGAALLQNLSSQADSVKTTVDTKLYELVGKIHELGFQSERFDRVESYTEQIAIVPTSAETGEGIPELLMVLAGLAQKFLEKSLNIEVKGPAKGTVLEVKEEKGLGATIDVIIYDGTLRVNDKIVIGGLNEPITTKVRALLEPAPLSETRDLKTKFSSVKEVNAATGVKISAPDLKGVVSGMPVRVVGDTNIEDVKSEVQAEVSEVLIETDGEGIVIKADTLGGLEALTNLLKEKNIQIKSASIGNISKKDVAGAESNFETDPLKTVVLGFNVDLLPETKELIGDTHVKAITSDVIYTLIDQFGKWSEETKKSLEEKKLEKLVLPGKFRFLSGYIFRQSNPAVFGIEVLSGKVKTGDPVMNAAGKRLSVVKALQEEQKSITVLEAGKQAALSLDGVTVGRQVHEGDILYTDVPEGDFKKLKELSSTLTSGQKELLKEIASIKRENNPVWGV